MPYAINENWVTILSALLTPTIAVLGSYIAYRQWRTAQNKLKLELFDRRFAIYDAALNFIRSIVSSGAVNDDELYGFILGTHAAKWLLNTDIANYFKKQLCQKARELKELQDEIETLPPGEERKTKTQKRAELRKWIFDQSAVLDDKFEPFLKVKH